ncbi:nucleotidyltransferase domain-containing protein [Streptomyces sp. NBC_01218]|uniref:nucleotidyltransferase domain-containing protein n=1 Tax=unclassified Streptomyces TaxID=2593676 RepID=UPI002E1028A3|nr:nucleotidyltransferase domain-containing protein [Streptomyces sp. NBC_01218]
MDDSATQALIDRFLRGIREVLPEVTLWAHGSLAGGDYRPGRSDLDLIAVTDLPPTPQQERRLAAVHHAVAHGDPLAAKLHCSYVAVPELADTALTHTTWAHEELTRRPVTPVTRRELASFGAVLHGRPVASVLPPVTDEELAEFILGDLEGFWLPALDHPDHTEYMRHDIWVDLALLTPARAAVTLRTGRLITKGEALEVLRSWDAPPEVVADIEERRYGSPAPATEGWTVRRGRLARDFARTAVGGLIAEFRPGTGTHP